jgi:hypothetical protein
MSASVCDFTFLKGVKVVDFTQNATSSLPQARRSQRTPPYD